MVRVEALTKTFEDRGANVLDGVDFHLARGESLAVIGPSGCGKTTLLYILAGLLRASSGTVLIGGRSLDGPSRETAFILQDYGLLPWRTVWQNVCLGMKIRGKGPAEQAAAATSLLAELGLLDLRDRYPLTLSGGEKQRVAIARALVSEPELLLMDEPFSSLDTLGREKLQELLIKLWLAKGLTMILVTHSIEEAVFLGQRILVLGRRPARVNRCLANPAVGRVDFRSQDSYFAACREVRGIIEASLGH